jgi:hypothetical protein
LFDLAWPHRVAIASKAAQIMAAYRFALIFDLAEMPAAGITCAQMAGTFG